MQVTIKQSSTKALLEQAPGGGGIWDLLWAFRGDPKYFSVLPAPPLQSRFNMHTHNNLVPIGIKDNPAVSAVNSSG